MKSKPSKLDPHAAQIAEWFGEPHKLSLAEVQLRLSSLGCSVSTGRLSQWWAARQGETMRDRLLLNIATGSSNARMVEDAFAKNPPAELKALIGLLKNLILTLTIQGSTDPAQMELANSLLKSALDFAKLEAKERDQRLETEKFHFDAAKAALAKLPELLALKRDTSLSDDQRLEQARFKLFGSTPK